MILYLSFLIAFIMLIWFKSDAILEWACIFGFGKIVCVEEFNHKRLESTIHGQPYNFPQFIKDKNNYNFISKMLGCPLCLSVWMSILFCGLVSILTLNILFPLMVPVVCVLSLLLYGSVTSLLKLQ